MRTKYGSTWSRLPSASLNQATKKQLEYYRQKYEQGKAADEKVRALIESKKEQLNLLELDKAGLIARIPKTKGLAESLSPAAAKLTELLKNLGELRKEAETITEGMIKSFESETVTSEMTQVYQKLKDKRTTFDELKSKYLKMMQELEENANKRKNVFPQIDAAMTDFSKEKTTSPDAAMRAEFFKSLDDACNSFNECHSNAQQGGHFHTQLAGYISKLMQTVNDFVMSRTLEKNDLINTISSQNFAAMGHQNPYIPRPAPTIPGYQYVESQIYSQPGYGTGAPGYPHGAPMPPRPGYGAPPAGYGAPPPSSGAAYPPGYPPQQPGYPPRPGYPPSYRY
jgi:hypothetical protein